MIADVDDALRNLIQDSLSVSQSTVDLKFDQPSRDWASRLNRPTIDLFLFDIRENLRLRGAEQWKRSYLQNGTVEVRRNPVRIDLRYLLTAWTKEAEDAHLLLSDALLALLRNPVIPDKYLSERLKAPNFPVNLDAAVFSPEYGPTEKITDIWGVIGNDIHAGFIVTVTITIEPYEPEVFRQVSEVERHAEQTDRSGNRTGSDSVPQMQTAYIIQTEKYSAAALSVILVERSLKLDVNENYGISLPPLPEGEYHLDILANGRILKRQKVSVPAAESVVII